MSISEYLPPGMAPDDLVMLASGISAFFAVLVVWLGLVPGDGVERRARNLAKRRGSLRAGLATGQGNAWRRLGSVGLMRGAVQRLNLLRSRQADETAAKLAQAGMRGKDAVVIFLFLKVALPLAAGVGAALLFYGAGAFDLAPLTRLCVAMAAVVAGAYAPDLFVKNRAQKRGQEITRGLPDALDLMVICAEAGLSMDAAFSRVAGEMAKASPEVADEFGLCSIELGFLPNRSQALANLSARTGLAAVRGVVNTLRQSERYGTPLAQSLKVLASEFRNDRMMAAEAKAARLPAVLTIPLILFILPSLFVVLLGPAVLSSIDGLSRF